MECPKCGLVQADAPACVGCHARVRPGRPAAREHRELPAAGFGSLGLTDRSKALWLRQLARLLRAGIPPVAAVESLGGSVGGRRLRAVAAAIAADLRAGRGLGDALARLPRDFDAHETGSVAAAELTGALPLALDRLGERLERRRERARRILGGLAYPAFVFALSFFLLPIPQLVLGDTGGYLRAALLPLLTVAALVTAAVWLRGRLRRHPRVAPALDAVAARTPFLGAWRARTARATFCEHLGRALAAGLPVGRALRSAGAATGDPRYEALAADAERRVLGPRGGSLAEALRASRLFPDEALLIITTGERSGDLADALETVARHTEADLDQLARVLTRVATVALSLVLLGWVAVRIFSGMTAALDFGHEALERELPGLFRDLPTDRGGLQDLLDQADEALRGPGLKPIPR
jgi:type IV pilus assembly protein PilC